ncbi:MAG: ATP-grasp domain-containing protein [Gemmatimonadota bacterium]|nr:MAG: ATP-grasp domain-containing protein [Gemmatimonadota bacterium]
MASVLVTDGEQRAALAVVRSLGRRGHEVHVCSTRSPSLAGASRFARSDVLAPSPLEQAGAFVDKVAELAAAECVDVLIPITDPSLMALLPAKERFGAAVIPFPPAETHQSLSNKQSVLKAASEIGIAVPRQTVARTAADLPVDWEDLNYPVALKPVASVVEREGVWSKVGITYADSTEALRLGLKRYAPESFPILIQERIVGDGVGIFLLEWGGELLAAFSHRRIREKPPSGGVSVLRESYPADPQLVELSRELIRMFGWSGVCMVEYKVDHVSRTPYLMEVNARFWGSLQLAVDAGVDFPTLLVDAALGREVEPVSRYKVGVRSRWEWGDIDSLLLMLRRSPEELCLAGPAPGRLRAIGQFLAFSPTRDKLEVFRLSDMMPFVRETIDWFEPLWRRLKR